MAQVLVRDLDPAVVETLKARAADHGRSLQAELKSILETQARQVSRAEARALAARPLLILIVVRARPLVFEVHAQAHISVVDENEGQQQFDGQQEGKAVEEIGIEVESLALAAHDQQVSQEMADEEER